MSRINIAIFIDIHFDYRVLFFQDCLGFPQFDPIPWFSAKFRPGILS